jgi:serine/threonine protein phosphatase 1
VPFRTDQTQDFSLFVIGDVHGCAPELKQLLEKLPLAPQSTVVFLGDYVDRGPESRQVIEIVFELQTYCTVVPLMGNHEAMFLNFLADPQSELAGHFIYNGGSATLASYADDFGCYTIPQEHVKFIRDLELCYQTEEYFFVHAGVPEIRLEELNPDKFRKVMLWTRGSFLTTEYRWSKVVVHGHTAVDEVTIWPNRINLDTGCVFQGELSAMGFPGRKVFSVRKRTETRAVYLRDKSSDARMSIRFQGKLPVRVRMGAQSYDFETVNYSEAGMYMRDLTHLRRVFKLGDIIYGSIGSDIDSLTQFRGRVVRHAKEPVGYHYGVQILPFSSEE